ncbi:hypothetical protein [Streptomyces antimicrobicus]|uniref:Uncharacterized protein n=1 Tax=Streptomyces antimicrobicus TaxID=2883108 RepID=A0ABS8B8M6_9ACTN|nr:hypothetical protein [Streptomyces antimicrobicus]MCB5180959.1 hypothetical protein [Streptomyces antimicrobicus]
MPKHDLTTLANLIWIARRVRMFDSSLNPVVVVHSHPEPARLLTKTISAASNMRAQSTGAIGNAFSEFGTQPAALANEILHTFEPHADSELITASSRSTPFQECTLQPRDLVRGEQVTRQHRSFRHHFNPSQ